MPMPTVPMQTYRSYLSTQRRSANCAEVTAQRRTYPVVTRSAMTKPRTMETTIIGVSIRVSDRAV